MQATDSPLLNAVITGRYGHWSEITRKETKEYSTVYYLQSDELGEHADRIVTYIDRDGDMCEIGHGYGKRSSFKSICEDFEIV